MSKKSFLIFCLIFIAVSFSLSATAALVPTIAEYFGAAKSSAVRLTWIYMLPYGLFAFFWGPLSRSFTVKKLLLFSAVGFSVLNLAFSLSANISQAFIFRFLMGCVASGFVPLAFIVVGKAVVGPKKASNLGSFFAISTISACSGVFLSGFLPWQVIYLIPAVLSGLIFILSLTHLEEFDFRKEKFKLSYLETFKNKQALNLFVAIGLGSFLFHALQQNLGVYLSERFFLKQSAISLAFTVSTLCVILVRLFTGFLSSRLGNLKIVSIGYILMGVFSAVLLASGNYRLVILAVILWGTGWALSHTGLSAHLAHMPDKLLRDASSINSSLRLGLGGLGAFFGGLLSSSVVGFKMLFIIVMVSLFLLGFYSNRLLEV
ncbi:MAG: MFS transporter [Candidatus Omnitrophica bacterium]|nr:MFS transporter [Candidatus Omnitrophota bacterium]MBU2044930.1 MFS transporter [Candidatus Omnitrophota bacterium]MBU2250773.1 MFS transporter [Candidatus Omnitrophota bacterium]MBU2473124.1 MFS transporter [Candidatus Omnitrophota bacterium]